MERNVSALIRCLPWKQTIEARLCLIKRIHAKVLVSRGEMRHWVWKCCDCLIGQENEGENKDGKDKN